MSGWRVKSVGLVLTLVVTSAASAAQPSLKERVDRIADMAPPEMARTARHTSAAYVALLGYVQLIADRSLGDLVLALIVDPAAKVYGKPEQQSWAASPGGGWGSHHAYPGGLSVHTLESVELACAWALAHERIYGVALDRDLILAALIVHDWGKVYFLWDEAGKISTPSWYPPTRTGAGTGVRLRGHATLAYAELIHRNAPRELVLAVVAAHLGEPGEGKKTVEAMNEALAEAAAIAKRPPIVVRPEDRRPEWWVIHQADAVWSAFHRDAPAVATRAVAEVAQDLGLAPGSLQFNRLLAFVLSRAGEQKIYEIYRKAGKSLTPAKAFVTSVIENPEPYELPPPEAP